MFNKNLDFTWFVEQFTSYIYLQTRVSRIRSSFNELISDDFEYNKLNVFVFLYEGFIVFPKSSTVTNLSCLPGSPVYARS